MRLSPYLLPLAAIAGSACAMAPRLLEERGACDIISIPKGGAPITHHRIEYDAAGRMLRRICDGCDGRGMDREPDAIEQISRDGAGHELTEKLYRTMAGPAFEASETTTDASGCPIQRRFWRGTPEDWALDRVTCDEAGRQVATMEDLGLGQEPGKARTLRYDERGRKAEELFDRDIDGVYEERTTWRYGRGQLPTRRDWYLNGTLTARSDFERDREGVLLVEIYDYLVDGDPEVTLLYGYGCGAP